MSESITLELSSIFRVTEISESVQEEWINLIIELTESEMGFSEVELSTLIFDSILSGGTVDTARLMAINVATIYKEIKNISKFDSSLLATALQTTNLSFSTEVKEAFAKLYEIDGMDSHGATSRPLLKRVPLLYGA